MVYIIMHLCRFFLEWLSDVYPFLLGTFDSLLKYFGKILLVENFVATLQNHEFVLLDFDF